MSKWNHGQEHPTVADAADAGLVADAGAVAAGTVADGGWAADAGPISPDAGADLAKPGWADLALTDSAPKQHHIAVVLRLDQMRGTEWAGKAASILKPMPDHALIIGRRSISIADRFDMLFISTSDPADVTATNLACVGELHGEALRKFLSHDQVRVAWTPVGGGVQGSIKRSRKLLIDDERIYLQTSPNAVVLAKPEHLAPALLPRSQGGEEVLPQWVLSLAEVDAATRADDAPMAIAQLTMLPTTIAIPKGPTLPGPERVSIFLERSTAPQTSGFHLRGIAYFASDELAERFVVGARTGQRDALNSTLAKMLLRQMQAYNALVGLSLKRSGAIVSFSTSLSVADTRAIFDLAADWSRRFFGPRVRP